MTEDDIFNLNELSDLPLETKKQISLKLYSSNKQKVINLFDIKNPLNMDEIIVAFYRKHKVQIKRSWLINILYILRKKLLITKYKDKYYKNIGE